MCVYKRERELCVMCERERKREKDRERECVCVSERERGVETFRWPDSFNVKFKKLALKTTIAFSFGIYFLQSNMNDINFYSNC